MRHFVIEADGGSRGNPGKAGSGAVVFDRDSGELLVEIYEFIGVATNNVAEYRALLAAVRAALEIDTDARIEVRMDSKLVVEQMAGAWKIKHPDMRSLAIQIHEVLAGRQVAYEWIPREQNSRADALANRAMDEESSDRIWHTGAEVPKAPQTLREISSSVEYNRELPSSVRAPINVTKPQTTIILVRHGRTELTESKRISGSTGANPGLSEAGFGDAQAVAQELSRFGKSGQWAHLGAIDAIVSSPMQRTLDTANEISKACNGLSVQVEADLREISFGTWDGLTNSEAEAQDPALFQAWRGSWEVAPPGGESLEEFDSRIRSARNRILESFAGRTVVVVAHVMPIRGFLRFAFDASVAAYWRPTISPCSVSVLRLWGDEAAEVVAVNATSHLVPTQR